MAGATGPVPPLRFTTRDIPVPARRRALHELREQGLLPLEPLPGCTPRVDLLKWRLPGASILSGTFAGVRQGGESGPAAGDDLFFGINVSGCSLAGQRGHEVAVGAGDAVAVDPAAGPFGVLRAVPAQMIGLRVPRRSLPAGFGATALRLVPARTAALQLGGGGGGCKCEERKGPKQVRPRRRLSLAYQRLRHPRYATRTISSIASDTGFGDLSYWGERRRAIVGAVIVPARTSLPALTARRSSCAWRQPGCDLPLPGAVPVRYVRRPARPRRGAVGATAACQRRRVHTRHMGRIIGTVLGAILAVWLAVTAAGGIFASLKTFLVIGLIAMAVFIVVWLVARRPHRG